MSDIKRNERFMQEAWLNYIENVDVKWEHRLNWKTAEKTNRLDCLFYDSNLKDLHAVEIKSAKDNFNRLTDQLKAYMKTFPFVSVFVDYKHLDKARELLTHGDNYNYPRTKADYSLVWIGIYYIDENNVVHCDRKPTGNYWLLDPYYMHNSLNNKLRMDFTMDYYRYCGEYIEDDGRKVAEYNHDVEMTNELFRHILHCQGITPFDYYKHMRNVLIEKYELRR